VRCHNILLNRVATLGCVLPHKTDLNLAFELGLIARWHLRPAEAGECPEGVQRIRRVGVSMGANAPSDREGEEFGEDESRAGRGRSVHFPSSGTFSWISGDFHRF
jgi:hypothetical protein